MTLALALLGIFAIMAVLMYLNRLPAIVALPIMAIAIALVARVPWQDLTAIISDGAFRLHKAYATAILGAIIAEIVAKTGVAETMVKKTAELGGDRPIVLALLLTGVIALLFTTLGGLGAVIMVATIVFPVLLALGLPQIAVGCLFLLGMSLGGIFNPPPSASPSSISAPTSSAATGPTPSRSGSSPSPPGTRCSPPSSPCFPSSPSGYTTSSSSPTSPSTSPSSPP